MLIMSRVCVDFHDREGNRICRITPAERLKFLEVPDAIQEDPIFQMLVDEGSLEATVSVARRKQLENDPVAETDASGKKPKKPAAKAEEPAVQEEAKNKG